jgi:hypothetical protein
MAHNQKDLCMNQLAEEWALLVKNVLDNVNFKAVSSIKTFHNKVTAKGYDSRQVAREAWKQLNEM